MFVRVERGASAPISRQIAEQIRVQCLSGALKPGERLPSVRELARQLAVNVNTVFRVYERLVADKLIEMRHGDGTYVCPQSEAVEVSRQLTAEKEQYANEFDAILRRGLLLGLSPTELRRMLTSSVSAAKRTSESGVRKRPTTPSQSTDSPSSPSAEEEPS